MRENAPDRDYAPAASPPNDRGGSQGVDGVATKEPEAHVDRIDEMFDTLNALLDAFIAAVKSSEERLDGFCLSRGRSRPSHGEPTNQPVPRMRLIVTRPDPGSAAQGSEYAVAPPDEPRHVATGEARSPREES